MRMMTDEQAVAVVHQRARYFAQRYTLPNGKKGGLYAVDFNGKVFHSDDTRDLVEQILADNNKGK